MLSPPRPLLWLALSLAAGILAGPELGSGALVALGLGATGALLLVRRTAGGRRLLPRGLLWVPCVALLAALRAREAGPPPALPAASPASVRRARERPCLGIFHARGAGRGVLEPPGGTLPCGAAPPLLYAFDGPPPPEGALALLLPGGEVRPWSRGPGGPRGGLAGLSDVGADELVVAGEPRTPWRAAREALARLRAAARRRLVGDGSEASPARRWWRALVLGEREALDATEVDRFARTGTRHLLAVSGLHVGLAAALLLGLRRLAGRPGAGRVGTLVVAAGIAAYAGLAGGEPPVLRAALAGTLALLRPRGPGGARRRADPLALWGLALAGEGLVAPEGLGELGLQLSYGATLALLVTTGPLAERLLALVPHPRAPLQETRRGALARGIGRRLGRSAAGALAASAAAFLATLPLLARSFGEVAPAGVLLTPLLVPGLFVVVGTGLAFLALPLTGLERLAEAGTGAMEHLLALADRLPGTPLSWPPRPLALLVLTVVATLLFLARRPRPGARPRRLGRLVAGLWALVLLPWAATPAGLEVHALDVGHGTAVLVRAPGLPALLFDAGSRDRPGVYEEAVGPLLCSWEVTGVDIVLSHDHRDHDAALADVARTFAIRSWAGAPPDRSDERLVHAPPAVDLERGRARLPFDRTPLGLTLIRGTGEPGNEGSRLLELRWGTQRVLLAGDAEGEGLRRALEEGWIRGPVRLLLFPHHGSDGPYVGRLLETARPGEVWISTTGRAPAESEIARRGIPLRTTARQGCLALALRGERASGVEHAGPGTGPGGGSRVRDRRP